MQNFLLQIFFLRYFLIHIFLLVIFFSSNVFDSSLFLLIMIFFYVTSISFLQNNHMLIFYLSFPFKHISNAGWTIFRGKFLLPQKMQESKNLLGKICSGHVGEFNPQRNTESNLYWWSRANKNIEVIEKHLYRMDGQTESNFILKITLVRNLYIFQIF